jgi:hypothetical protein
VKTLRTAALFTAALALLCAGHAAAQSRMYKCVDAKGKVYYTQTPPQECLGREVDELSRQGRVTKRAEPAPTVEQQAAREEERKKLQEQEVAAREEKRKNQALLNTYPTEKDIDEARSRALKDNELAIKEAQKRLAGAEKRKKELDAEKEFYVKKPMPPKLQDEIKTNEVEIKNQGELLEAQKKQVATINAKYDEDKKRFLELTKGGAAGGAARGTSGSATAAAKAAPKK